MYHKVGNNYSEFIPALNSKVFEKQIKLLTKLYDVVSLEDIFSQRIKDRKRAKAVITFDDGYKCIYKYAFPILKKYKIPANVFLTVDAVESNQPIWSDLLSCYIGFTKMNALELSIGENKFHFELTDRNRRLNSLNQIKALLKGLQEAQKLLLLEEIKQKLDVDNPDNGILDMLSWDEIKEMSENNIYFGGHTLTHPILTKITLEKAKHEVLNSKEIIEKMIGRPVTTFAYPNGQSDDFNSDIKKILSESGYKSACTTVFGKNDINTDRYELRRIYTSGNSLFKFRLRLRKA